MKALKFLKKKKIKLFLKIKNKHNIHCKKLTSKIFYNLTYIYIKNNFLLINKLIKINFLSNFLFKKHYILNDNENSNDLFILNYLDTNFNNKFKTMININKNKKPLSIITLLKKIIFSHKKFFRLLKNEKKFLKLNLYHIFFFLFYYYMLNSFSYLTFIKINKKKKKNSLFTLNLFLKKKLKRSFKFFFKNIIMFLYKYSTIKNKKRKLFKIVRKKNNNIFRKFKRFVIRRKKIKLILKKIKIMPFEKKLKKVKYINFKEYYKKKLERKFQQKMNRKKRYKQLKLQFKKKKNIFFPNRFEKKKKN